MATVTEPIVQEMRRETYGVARKAHIIAVKAPNSDSDGKASDIKLRFRIVQEFRCSYRHIRSGC